MGNGTTKVEGRVMCEAGISLLGSRDHQGDLCVARRTEAARGDKVGALKNPSAWLQTNWVKFSGGDSSLKRVATENTMSPLLTEHSCGPYHCMAFLTHLRSR